MKKNTISRKKYSEMYGPTFGDKIRLGDTCLWAEIEKDYSTYGEECVFGGGKTIRDGMAQNPIIDAENSLDLVITNAIIIDTWGIVKADIGIKNGLIVGIGKSGNHNFMDGVTNKMFIGTNTEVISAENRIVTAGCVDSHVHYICPQILESALHSGTTTIIGGGFGPTTGTLATNCTAGKWAIQNMIKATDHIPINLIFLAKGSSTSPNSLIEQIHAGAGALKIHEDWGSTPAVIENCLKVADQFDIQVNIHTDSINESGYLEKTIDTFKKRTIHGYHIEGAGGGHVPDLLKMVSYANILPSSTTPTIPYTINTVKEHLSMLMNCHHLDQKNPEDVAFAKSRIREETISVEGILHDIGAISMISSDSQAMGRICEITRKTWQTADRMKKERGVLLGNNNKSDNFRIKRYIAKYTINPSIAHGINHLVGSIEKNKMADLVLWKPAFFGVKPEMVLKSGMVVSANIGDLNASISSAEPRIYRFMFGKNNPEISSLFVSQATINNGSLKSLKLKKRIKKIQNCRKLSKKDLLFNTATPQIVIDPVSHIVYIDGEKISSSPASKLPLSQKYFLF